MKKSLLYAVLAIAGCWMGTTEAQALDEVDGVYQIKNAQDLEDFSNLVASGTNTANAVLTNDIDMLNVTHTPIGTTGSLYRGTFDGQEHYIRNLNIVMPAKLPDGTLEDGKTEADHNYTGLFGVIGDGAYIKNLIIDASCSINGSAWVGAFAGGTNGSGTVTFENCGNQGMVSAVYENAAGICGVSMGGQCAIKIYRCFNTGGIVGGRESAAFCGWCGNGSEVMDCYNLGYVVGMDGQNSLYRNGATNAQRNYDSYGYQGTQISDDEYDLTSGLVCYMLNGSQSSNVKWYQTLGTDTYPLPFASHGVVYAVGELYCDGSPKGGDPIFSNTDESKRDDHDLVDGICKVCGTADKDYLPLTADGYYELSNALQLNWFATLVNQGNKELKARLTADIDFTAYTKKDVVIGGNAYSDSSVAYDKAFENSEFDGQGHQITVAYQTSYKGTALFKIVRNSVIRNLRIAGTVQGDEQFVGGLAYVSRGNSTYENIIVSADLKSAYQGDGTHGGLIAICHENATIRNCGFVGTIDAPKSEGSAAFVGYAHSNTGTSLTNCYVATETINLTGNSVLLARNVLNRLNCYYTNNIVTVSDDTAEPVDPSLVASGELCYLINKTGANGAWRQEIGVDQYPVPFESSPVVYANGNLRCDGKLTDKVTYSNTESEAVRDDHKYQNDICDVCGARIIRNGQQLKALADAINNAEMDGDVIVDLAANIDLSGINFQGIGTRVNNELRPFKGTFDGHGYRIDNMLIEAEEGNKGLFGVASGATIKNVVVSGEIYTIGWSGGIVGTACGRRVLTIENCGNEAMVNVGQNGPNAAGILGVNDGSEAIVNIINCYNVGDIIGARECGAISGWMGDNGTVQNCYNAGSIAPESIDGSRTFFRSNGNGVVATNCFEVTDAQILNYQVATVDPADVANGRLCYLLNEGAGETIYYQTLGEDLHPVLDATHKKVVKEGDHYVNEGSTGIYNAQFVRSSQSVVYDLQGRRVAQPAKGLYIVNGKKVLVP